MSETPSMTSPQPLGLAKSFGFGDRLGVATPGHLAAARKYDFAPIFAQQSIREMTRTGRTPLEVMYDAASALSLAGYSGTWGADADHLKHPEDAALTAAAGFCFFTIDPSEHVDNRADTMSEAELEVVIANLGDTKTGAGLEAGWIQSYLSQDYDLGDFRIAFSRENLLRAACKYGRAIAHCAVMARAIETTCGGRPFEIEISVDETETPTTEAEHLFVALELKRRGVRVVSLAPRFVGDFEKGIDYRGDIAAFEASLRRHVAVARQYGPYKISVHSGSDKFSIYPIVGRVCGELLHVKTAGTSYLEALRVVARAAPALFHELAIYAHQRFAEDRHSYHISTTVREIELLAAAGASERERLYLDERAGRQLMHVTFGSVLTKGRDAAGRPFKMLLMEILAEHGDLYGSLLEAHFDRHLSGLNAG